MTVFPKERDSEFSYRMRFLTARLARYLRHGFDTLRYWEPRSVAMRNAYDCFKLAIFGSTFGLLIFVLLYAPVSVMVSIANYRPEYLEPRANAHLNGQGAPIQTGRCDFYFFSMCSEQDTVRARGGDRTANSSSRLNNSTE
jgi:hypothetical protein